MLLSLYDVFKIISADLLKSYRHFVFLWMKNFVPTDRIKNPKKGRNSLEHVRKYLGRRRVKYFFRV